MSEHVPPTAESVAAIPPEDNDPALAGKVRIQLHIDDKCPICHAKFFSEKKTLEKGVVKSDTLGPVHHGCIMPYTDEKQLKLLIKLRCWSMGDVFAATQLFGP